MGHQSTNWMVRFVLIVATAAQHRWKLLTADIEKAFLQGLTYAEMRNEGQEARGVNFQLPPGSYATSVLREGLKVPL